MKFTLKRERLNKGGYVTMPENCTRCGEPLLPNDDWKLKLCLDCLDSVRDDQGYYDPDPAPARE